MQKKEDELENIRKQQAQTSGMLNKLERMIRDNRSVSEKGGSDYGNETTQTEVVA
jgi:hypothetical protein